MGLARPEGYLAVNLFEDDDNLYATERVIGAPVATQELGVSHVLLADFDVHRGDGIQTMS